LTAWFSSSVRAAAMSLLRVLALTRSAKPKLLFRVN
jgi:hypothetical protein